MLSTEYETPQFCVRQTRLPDLLNFRRSEKRSTIVTADLPFSKWIDLFENTTMVAAPIDLTFHNHVLGMSGDAYRE